jgi:HAD superfamily hydrolase (TIGR01509 family)
MMIKAVLFDYDGVITIGAKDGVPAMRLASNLGISYDEAAKWIVSIWNDFSTGIMSDSEAWQKIEEHYGRPITLQQRDIWYTWDELRPLPKMLELVRNLKEKGYPVGVVSNVLPMTAQLIQKNGGYDEFDFLTLSYEAGARKPDIKIYEAAMENLKGISANEVLFLDDRKACTDAADNLGMNTIQVTNHDEAVNEVHALTVRM